LSAKKKNNQEPRKIINRCRSCGVLFSPPKGKAAARYCYNKICQKEKKLRNNKTQKERQHRLKEENNTPPKLERTDQVCICCRVKNVPRKKIRGVYLSVLCEECYINGESDVLNEHRILE
jgi:hypothetical protein